ncbi:MAG: TIGR04283 family arsenosugar biosynthesis glycosyltransferase [Proteobacteria bacterium]|nr:TIGR04283 family arsenosugar biosynthesis glycosyltransferase [Pseudomonadota bacterium]
MRIAVVIPALDEAETVEAAIASARSADEIVVVDGGSLDRTADRARAVGAKLISSPRGRARQLEAGWRATGAEVVLFLHADTRLPLGWAEAVRAALSEPDVAGGAFRLRFDERSLALRIIEFGAHRRAAWAGLPYGDQAIFARRTVLEAIGGIAQVPIAEDLDLACDLRGHGRLALLPLAIATSARRYQKHGALRTWARHTIALAAWRLGIDRARIARWVRG